MGETGNDLYWQRQREIERKEKIDRVATAKNVTLHVLDVSCGRKDGPYSSQD